MGPVRAGVQSQGALVGSRRPTATTTALPDPPELRPPLSRSIAEGNRAAVNALLERVTELRVVAVRADELERYIDLLEEIAERLESRGIKQWRCGTQIKRDRRLSGLMPTSAS